MAAAEALSALKKAEMFIENGVELGFIRLPDHGDPALETLPTIKAAIRALSAEPVQGEQWQPIETAPKDGTVIDLWCKHSEHGGSLCRDAKFINGNWRAGKWSEPLNLG